MLARGSARPSGYHQASGHAGLATNIMSGVKYDVDMARAGVFKQVIGDFPFKEPNVDMSTPDKTQETIVETIPQGGQGSWLCAGLCCLTGFGACYVCQRQVLIDQGTLSHVLMLLLILFCC